MQIEKLKHTLGRLDNQIHLVNIKALMMLFVDFIVLSIFILNQDEIARLLRGTYIESMNLNFIVTVAVLLAISVICSLKVVFGDLDSGSVHTDYYSILNWGNIADMKSELFVEASNGQTEEEYIKDFYQQIHMLAKALKEKQLYLNGSYICLFLVIVVIILSVI